MFVENIIKRNAARKAVLIERLKILTKQLPDGPRKRMLEARIMEWEKIPPEDVTKAFIILLIVVIAATAGYVVSEFRAARRVII